MPTTDPKPTAEKDMATLAREQSNLRETSAPTPTEIEPQSVESREQKVETKGEIPTEVGKEGKFIDEAIEGLKHSLRSSKTKPNKIPQVRDDVTIKVEKIMEEGLVDAYRAMTPVQQQEFKIQGEKTAMEIRALLGAGKVKMKKIFQLLVGWLKMLPGVNRFFLEQEAKIKADKIITLKKIDDNLLN